LAAALFGISAAVATNAAISPYVATGPVVVAGRDIEQFQRVEAADVRVQQVPMKALPKGRFSSEQEILGAYAASRIVEGQILLRGHVVQGESEAGLSLNLPYEMRCIFVPAGPERGVGGFVKPGELVDIVFTPRAGGYAGPGGAAAPATVRGVRVLEVCTEPSSRALAGVVVLTDARDAEAIAHNIESCAVSLLLAPRDPWVPSEPEVWLPR
jgi:pilus assembly protein CpaB